MSERELVRAELPDPHAMMTQAQKMIAGMETIEITDQSMYDLVSAERKRYKSKVKELTEQRMSITRKLDDAKNSIMDLFKPPIQLLEEGAKTLDKKLNEYYLEQERKRKEEEARLRAEQRAVEERARKEAEEARLAAAAAVTAEEKAQAEAKAKIADQTASVAAVTAVAPETEKLKGARKTWDFEIEDESKIPLEYMMPDEKKIRAMVVATKGKVAIPGIRPIQKVSRSGR